MKNCTAVYRHFGGLLLMCVALVLGGPAFTVAAPSLPFVSPMFGDNMVLQRNKPNTFWGWAAPGEKVRVEIGDKEGADTAGPDGRWEIKVQPPTGAGPITVRIVGRETVQFQNVLVGDVWVCGGQSNMQFPLQSARNGEAELQQADHPQIRFFIVKSQPAYSREAIVQGSWKICSPKTVTEEGGLSAVAYYFARRLQTELNVPIGLIQDCLGGTPAEAWTSPQTLRQLKDFDAALDEVQRLHAKGGPQYGNYIMHWYDEFDIGQRDKGWSAAEFDDSDWKTVTIPGGFGELGVPDTPSLCYFRKTITLPEPLPPGPALIHLGVVEKMDTTYVNGHWVGASAWVENPRAYAISPGILKPGKNIVTVRVLKLKPDGGFQSKPDQLSLVLGDKSVIPLAGEWKGKLSVDARAPHPLPLGFENWPVMPGVLYDGMLAPVAPLALTGAIWYQGEANASHAFQYRTLMPMMIADWRKLFGQGDFPFYIVSLPKFGQHRDTPGDDAWAEAPQAVVTAVQAATAAHPALRVRSRIVVAGNE